MILSLKVVSICTYTYKKNARLYIVHIWFLLISYEFFIQFKIYILIFSDKILFGIFKNNAIKLIIIFIAVSIVIF